MKFTRKTVLVQNCYGIGMIKLHNVTLVISF